MFQELFDAQLKLAVFERTADLIEDKLRDQGVPLSQEDRKRLVAALRSGTVDSVSFGRWRFWDRRRVSVALTSEDLDRLDQEMQAMLTSLPDIVPKLVEEITPVVVKQLEKGGGRALRRERRILKKFHRRLEKDWASAFEALEMVIRLSMQVGQDVGGPALREEAEEQLLASVLLRLHGRGLRIGSEVLTLLRGGFPDAALARWRTLHEVTVVASFISDHGEPCAERYVAHQSVANYKGALRYQKDAPRLGFQPFTEEEFEEIQRARDEVRKRYGKDFERDYGWALPFLQGRPSNLAEIEEAVSSDHLRSVYKWASQEVHAGVKALYADLAAPPGDIILVGPTNTGFADPGQNTCISLGVLSTTLLQVGPNMDGLVSCSCLNHFIAEAISIFIETQQIVEARSSADRDATHN